MEGWLKRPGYNVILASDGVEAMEKFKANPDEVDIIVMDMIMHNKSGREAFEEIPRSSPSARVVFISGYSTPPCPASLRPDRTWATP